jgi:O-antigen ligase
MVNKFDLRVLNYVTAYSLFGYPINAALGILLFGNADSLNFITRLLLLFLYIYLLYRYRNQGLKVDWNFFLFMSFWFVYFIRLIYDVSYRGIEFIGFSESKVYQVAIFLTFVPAGVTALLANKIKINNLVVPFGLVLFLSNLLIFYILITLQNGSLNISNERLEVTDVNERAVVSPILVSMWGGLLLIFNLAVLLNKTISQNVSRYFGGIISFTFLGFLLSVFNLFLGASRGPFLYTLLIVIMITFIIFYRRRKFLYLVIFLILFILAFFFFDFASNLANSDILVFQRLFNSIDDRRNGIVEARDLEYASAINQFLSSPIFGDKIIENATGFYPHNILLESFMATGIIGGFLMLILQMSVLFRSFKFVIAGTASSDIIVFPFFMFFLLSMSSGCIILSNYFWLSLLLVLRCDLK